MIYSNNRFAALGPDSTILTSENGLTWTKTTFDSNYAFKVIAYGNNQFVALGGSYGSIYSSSNGTAWTSRSTGLYKTLVSVTYGNNKFVVAGEDGLMLTSSDGITWKQINSGTNNYLYSVTYVDDQFMAVGDRGTILISKSDTIENIQHGNTTLPADNVKINVVNKYISILFPRIFTQSRRKVEIVSIAGKIMYRSTSVIKNGILTIPAAGFPTGMYFMSIMDESYRTLTSPFYLIK
jgi:hypothetical protein